MISFNLQTTTGVYVGVRHVYVAQLKGTLFGPRLVKFGQVEIQAPAQSTGTAKEQGEAKAEAIKRAFRENNITAKKVITALPGKEVLIRYFQMPRIPRSEWETAIRFEAKRHIPFKIEELFWDFQVAKALGKDAKMDVTFVAVKKEIAQSYLSLLERAGLKPLALEPAPFSLVRLFASSNQLAKDKPTAIVAVDYGMADINILKEKICYLTRDVSLPLEEEMVFENLLNEVRMSLDYYEKIFPTEVVGKILLCGEEELKDWDRRLAEELKVPVEKTNLAKAIKVRAGALPPLNMAVAIGLALRGRVLAPTEVNLYQVREVKPEVLPTKRGLGLTPQLRRAVFRAVAISCTGLLILHLAMLRRIGQEKKQLEWTISLKPKIGLDIGSFSYAEIEKVKKELENKLSTLDLIIDKRVFWTAKFNELPKIIPPGMWLTDLSFTDELSRDNRVFRSLTIKGAVYQEDPAQGIETVTGFVSDLKENKNFFQGFTEIKLDSMTSAELKGMPVKNFTISCLFKK